MPVPAVIAATTPEIIQSRTSLRSVSRASLSAASTMIAITAGETP